MSKTKLREELEFIVDRIKKEKELFEKKIDNIDYIAAAKDPKIYEKFVPIIDQFQEDLIYITNTFYEINNSINDKLGNMYDEIEKKLEELDSTDLEDINSMEENNSELEETLEADLEGSIITTEITYNEKIEEN
jgi:hypothetical protein